ncbi:MAG: hypothetical protein ACR2QK_16550, partial [Acidimicrobiales bacterium]
EAVGRRRTASVLREARETEAGQTAEAEEAEATGRQRAELARVQADLVIAEQENKLRVRRAELAAEAMASEKRATVASEQARVVAEQTLEGERIELQKRRLEADVIAPARAKREAMELEARGRAASIVEDGNANIAVFEKMASEYEAAGSHARDVVLLNMLPDLVEQITETVSNIDIDRVTVIDGSGSSTGGISNLAGQMPSAVISIVEQIENATGVNLLEVLVRERADGSGADEDIRVASPAELVELVETDTDSRSGSRSEPEPGSGNGIDGGSPA